MRASLKWWWGSGIGVLMGLIALVTGAFVQVQRDDPIGLYWLVGGAFFLAGAGIAATVATKYQQREEQQGKEQSVIKQYDPSE